MRPAIAAHPAADENPFETVDLGCPSDGAAASDLIIKVDEQMLVGVSKLHISHSEKKVVARTLDVWSV